MQDALDEIEALKSIYEDDIVIERREGIDAPIIVRKKVRPNDEGGVSSASIVVQFQLGTEYPNQSPGVLLVNPRGISDEDHVLLQKEVLERMKEQEGMPILFDILQYCTDFLLSHQHSASLLCPICLVSLSSSTVYCTPCDHYTHTDCLKEHARQSKKQMEEKLEATPMHMRHQVEKCLRCPVCRESICDDMEMEAQKTKRMLVTSSPLAKKVLTEVGKDEFDFDWNKWRQEQQALQKLFEKQKQQGGIIDLVEESKKNLITEETVVVLATNVEEVTLDASDIPPGLERPKGRRNGRSSGYHKTQGYHTAAYRGRPHGQQYSRSGAHPNRGEKIEGDTSGRTEQRQAHQQKRRDGGVRDRPRGPDVATSSISSTSTEARDSDPGPSTCVKPVVILNSNQG